VCAAKIGMRSSRTVASRYGGVKAQGKRTQPEAL
jgi:hypothetical protein